MTIDINVLLSLAVFYVAMPLNWYVVWKLRRRSKQRPRLTVLRERWIAALAVALMVTVYSLIFINNDLPTPVLSFAVTKLFTRASLLLAAIIPALYWLKLYR